MRHKVIPMGNRDEHMIEGAGLAILSYFIDKHMCGQPARLNEIVEVGVVGAIGGTVPDILEPPTNPRHRGTAHSFGALTAALKTYNYAENPMLSEQQKRILKAFSLGYAGHIISDSGTPAGVSII